MIDRDLYGCDHTVEFDMLLGLLYPSACRPSPRRRWLGLADEAAESRAIRAFVDFL